MNEKKSVRNASRLITPVRLGVVAVAACFVSMQALSNPVNPTVVSGSASFNQAGNVLTVTNSNGAIINWDKFSIKAGETTHFAQTSASSSVLNRVLNDPTAIYGTLSSNGRVWLVNPAGIMVGAGGRVDVAGFVASTLNISNADFLAGRTLFANDGTAQNVINQGEIKTPSGGSVYLIGSNVSNEGIITTPQGETILAAGQTVSLIDSATPGVKVDITGAAGNATNLGQITAEAGRIGIAGVIVRNSGTLNASSVVSEGGRVFLKASQDAYVDGSGRIVTTGTRGGHVEVLGNRVAVMDNASIDASATSEGGDGGKILVGGDYQGKNPDIQNANITYFGANANLKADAGKVGAGGTVIVWADDTTRAYGSISAKGGAQSGDGGFVETSGKRFLDVEGITVSTSATGAHGKWLLDPTDITILGGTGSTTGGSFSAGSFTPGASASTIYANTISSNLNSTDVTITSTSGSAGLGDITFDGSTNGAISISVNASADRRLDINAHRAIVFSGQTTFSSATAYGLAVVLNADTNNSSLLANGVRSNAGSLVVLDGSNGQVSAMVAGPNPAQARVWANSGTITMNGDSNVVIYDNDSTDYGRVKNLAGGIININSSNGWSFLSAVAPFIAGSGLQQAVVENAGTINVGTSYTAWAAKYDQVAGGVLNIGAGNVLSMQNAGVISGAVNLGAAGSLRLSETHGGARSFLNTTITGPGWIDTVNGATTFSGVTVNNASLVNSAGDLTIPTGIIATTGDIGLLASGVMYGGAGLVSTGQLMLVGGWNTASSVTAPTVTSGVGSIQITGGQVSSGGSMTLKSGNSITLTDATVSSGGTMNVAAQSLNINAVTGPARLISQGNQTITLGTGAANSSLQLVSTNGEARLSTYGSQVITFNGSAANTLQLQGSNNNTTYGGNAARIEAGGTQTITKSAGSLSIDLTAGTGTATYGGSSTNEGVLVCLTCATHNQAQISSVGNQTVNATAITVTGGGGGNGNWAGIESKSTSSVVASGAITITGGASGGAYFAGPDGYVSNDAGISADGALSVTAGSIVLVGGAAAYGGAYIGGSSSITVTTTGTGNLTLTGGTTAAQGAALTYADASPVAMKWLAPAVIGSDAGSLTNITLNVGGDLTLNGGAVGQDGGSMALIGGVRNTPINLVVNSRAITLNSANALADRIGSKAGGTISLHSGVGGTGSMTLGLGLIGTGYGMGGSVLLNSVGTGPGVFQTAGGMIATDWLNATATGAGPIDLVSFENRVGNFDATTSTGLVTFKGQSIGLGTINSGTGGAIISALYDIHDNNGSALNISGPSITLQSSLGGSAGSRAISADVAATASIVAQVNGGAANGGIRIANTSAAQPTSVTLTDNASAGTSASFSQKFTGAGTLAATGSISLTALYGGDISLLSNDGLDYSSTAFNTGGAGSIGLGASGMLAISAALSVGNNDLLLAGSTVNIAAPVTTTADLIVAGSSVNINSSVSALDIGLAAGSLTIGNTGGLLATNSLVAVVTGDVNINGGYIKTSAGDLEMLIGGNLNIGNASYGGDIWAGYNKMSPYFPDASIAVRGNINLNNGGHIKAANDVFLDLLGANSVLALNTGVLGPSYILSDIGTAVPTTTHLTFLTRNSGGILIDGVETTKTVVGGSGFFAVNSSTPALPGAGLKIIFASQANDSIAAQLVNALSGAIEDASTSETPTDTGAAPKFETAKGEGGGDKEGGFGDDEDKDKKKADDPKDGKKDDKPASKKDSQCT